MPGHCGTSVATSGSSFSHAATTGKSATTTSNPASPLYTRKPPLISQSHRVSIQPTKPTDDGMMSEEIAYLKAVYRIQISAASSIVLSESNIGFNSEEEL
jgi:hypothetical protein